jgi:integrase
VRQRVDQFAKIGVPKSEAGRRSIPLAPELVSALREWKVACPINRKLELVFPSSDGEIEHHHNMLHVLATLMRAAGVVTPDGKPKYATHRLPPVLRLVVINPKELGGREIPPKVAQTLLGHSSVVMRLDVYGHLFRDGGDRAETGGGIASVAGVSSVRARIMGRGKGRKANNGRSEP